jgi:lipopolysaccharide biosynthesis protein
MFWLRPAALRVLLDAHLEGAGFEAETGQLDGTLAHAVERVFCLAARSQGFATTSVAGLLGLADTDNGRYPYARRSG